MRKFDVFFRPESVLFFLAFTEEGITQAAKKVQISQTRGHTYVKKFIDGGLVQREYRGVYSLTKEGKSLKNIFEHLSIDNSGGVELVK